MNRPCMSVAIALALLSTPLVAQAGKLPGTMKVAQHELKLNGEGVREKAG